MQKARMQETDWDEVLLGEMEWARNQLRTCTKDEEFVMRVRVVGPNGQMATTPLIWRSEEEKRKAMWSLSNLCEYISARAAIIVSDARFLNMPGFCKRFGLAEPSTMEAYAEFDKGRHKVMEVYGHYMGNLPADCYNDTLMVVIYGPRVTKMSTVRYRRTGADIAFEPMIDGSGAAVRVGMLKAWWD